MSHFLHLPYKVGILYTYSRILVFAIAYNVVRNHSRVTSRTKW